MYVLTVKADSLQVEQVENLCNPVCLFFSLEADSAELRADFCLCPQCACNCVYSRVAANVDFAALCGNLRWLHICVCVYAHVRACMHACVSATTSRGVRV